MRRLTRAVALVTALAATAPAWGATQPAAGTLAGTITDATGGVLPGVLVTATDAATARASTATTGPDGAYSIVLVAGAYEVSAALPGFATFRNPAIAVTATTTAQLDVALEVAAYGDTVIVTGSRAPEALRTAPAAVTVLRAAEIERTPATNYGDLLRGVPGVNAVEISARDIQITTRTAASASARSTLALVDGRSVYQDYFGMVLWDLLPLELDDLKQVEVARGPGSAVWGANALTGTINLITKSPSEDQGTRVRIGVGERATRDLGLAHAGATERLSYKASASYHAQSNWDRPAALPDGTPLTPYRNRGMEQFKGSLRVDVPTGPATGWRFDAGVASSGGLILTSAGPFESRVMRQAYGAVEYARKGASITAYATAHRARYDGLLTTVGSAADSVSLQVEAKKSHVVGQRHLVVYGVNARRSHFDLSFVPNEDRRSEAGAFVSDDIHVSPRVRVSGGARLDWFDTTGATLSPRVGVRVDAAEGHTLRATYNRAYIAPSLVQNFILFQSPLELLLPTGPFTSAITVVGDRNLAPETSDGFETGYTGDLGSRVTLGLSLYRAKTSGLLAQRVEALYTPADPPPGWPLPVEALAAIPLPKRLRWGAVGDVVESGLEVSLDARLGAQVSATASYSLQARPDVTADNPALVPAVNVPPRHRATAGLSFSRSAWMGAVTGSFTDRAFFTDVLAVTGWTPRFALVNATLGRRLAKGRVTWLVKGTNLFDRRVQHHLFGDLIGRRVTTELRLQR